MRVGRHLVHCLFGHLRLLCPSPLQMSQHLAFLTGGGTAIGDEGSSSSAGVADLLLGFGAVGCGQVTS